MQLDCLNSTSTTMSNTQWIFSLVSECMQSLHLTSLGCGVKLRSARTVFTKTSQVQGKFIPLCRLYLFCFQTEVTQKIDEFCMPYRFLYCFSQSMPALCFPCWTEHFILWVLSKFESEIPLTLLPWEFNKVQQTSSLWAATKPSLVFMHIKACSEFSYKQSVVFSHFLFNLVWSGVQSSMGDARL